MASDSTSPTDIAPAFEDAGRHHHEHEIEAAAVSPEPEGQDGRFWSRFESTKKKTQVKDQEEIDSKYDLTERRINQIYNRFFSNSSKHDGLKQALAFQDIHLTDEDIHTLLNIFPQGSEPQSEFDVRRFQFVFIRLKIAQLLQLSKRLQPGKSMKVTMMEYPDFPEYRTQTGSTYSQPLEEWIFKESQSNTMRYQLHPLAVEDAIEMHKQPAKIDRYGEHVFCALNVLQLNLDKDEDSSSNKLIKQASIPNLSNIGAISASSIDADVEDSKSLIERGTEPVRLSASYVCMFLPPGFRTLISIRVMHNDPEIDNRFADRASSLASGKLAREWRVPSFSHISMTNNPQDRSQSPGDDATDADLFGIRGELKRPSSKLLDHHSDFLLYTIIDRSVDELSPIVAAYTYRLKHFQRELKRTGSRFPRACLEETAAITLELKDIQRTVRPLTGVLKFMLEDKVIGTDFAPYLEDLQDHVEQRIDDFRELVEHCNHIMAQHASISDRRMNDTLYVLTIVTTVFVPAQFVTGMYGMNFVDPDGSPGMPELEMRHGYVFFWLIVVGLSLLCAILFRFCL